MKSNLGFLNQEIIEVEKEYGESSLRVEEVLEIPTFSGHRVIAGHAGLQTLCRHLATLETPDGIEWLQGGEFLISAGYALRDDEDALKSFVFRAYKKGVSAIAIKEKRYIKEMPQEMIDQANKYRVPLIELPYSLIYTEAISKFYEALFYKKNQYILQTKNMHERLLNLVFDTKDIKGVIEVLSTLTNSSIVVYDSLYNLLGSSICSNNHEDIMKNFTDQGSLPQYGINLANYLIERKEGSYYINSYPITSNNKVEGYMYVICDDILSNLNKNAIAHGCMILSLRMVSDEKKYLNDIKIKKTITEIILNNENMHEEFYYNILNDFDWNDRTKFVGVSINIRSSGLNKDGSGIAKFKEELFSLISRFFAGEGFLITERIDKIFVFYSINNVSDCGMLIDKVFSLHNNYKGSIRLSFGVSRIYSRINDISSMYNDCYVTSLFNRESEVTYYDSLDTIKLLYPLKDDRQSMEYYQKTIKKLEEHDQKYGGNLIRTLEYYFKYDMNKKITARKLYIHIETLRYRLGKIESLTGYSLSTSEGVFVLQMNLKLHQILKLK